ncbi:MAG: DPP IV N-terminal domain-containing protein [Marinilabiliaceae bacterium]|nr:DPP IV N-terminal domain-containing protein [Marinilabiliaceae bacterium]
MSKFIFITVFFFLFLQFQTKARVTIDDYRRADSTIRFNDMVYQIISDVTWSGDSPLLWYRVKTKAGFDYKLVDAIKGSVGSAFNLEKLTGRLNKLSGKKYNPDKLKLSQIKFKTDEKVCTFVLDSIRWECKLLNYQIKKLDKIKKTTSPRYWSSTEGDYDSPPVAAPDSSYVAFVKENNVFVRCLKTSKIHRLSFDGSPGEFYSKRIVWSHDSKKLATFKVRPNEKHYIYFVESSPKDQLQPRLQKREYLKPGDALPILQPALFDVESFSKIEIDCDDCPMQYYLANLKWWPDSKAFTFEFNQRGHQAYKVIEVDAHTGVSRDIINETSKTFIDYSSKLYRYDINDTKEIIWASERDGWNHLYLIDAKTGNVKNQITKGNWVVRGVEYVNEKDRYVIFKGSGRNEGEDPYFIHYYKINLDGTDLVDLTPESYQHEAVFSSDYKYFVDTYSTVVVPPVSVLRKAIDGSVVKILQKADISLLKEAGWKTPEVFVAKGRDDKTDIWGNIYYPTNFDSTKSYPIIEYIYAGPHSSFVQKCFSPYKYYFSGLAELGFIIVQIDGMGTSNRSKAFHDVCYKNIKDAGFPDRIKWIKAAAEKHLFMDTTRVGIFGGSAGGQSSTAALLFHPGFYKVAVSSCGCHDNRMDKIWWNEQWLGYPIGKQYEENSNVCNAGKLQGDLMLILGEMDDNVDPASTMQLADALIKANKEFELVVLPGMNHTLGGDYGERKRRDFFVKNLYHQFPPKERK